MSGLPETATSTKEDVLKAVSALCLSLFFLGTDPVGAAPPLESVLAFSTFLPSGYGPSYGVHAVAVDATGATYVAGSFIESPIPPPEFSDAFVMKLSPEGEIVYTKILPFAESAYAIAVDGAGQAYVTGYALSQFEQVDGLASAYRGSGYEVFVAKLDASGSQVLYATAFGGAGRDVGWAIRVDPSGAIYIAGETWAPGVPKVGALSLPAKPSSQSTNLFVAKLIPGNPAPVWSAPFGGSSDEYVGDLAVDASGRLHLTGYTASPDFPTVNPLQGHEGSLDAFAVKLAPDGETVVYSTLLGGSGEDNGGGIAVDAAGRAWIGGFTNSDDFPLEDPLQATQNEGEGFVAGLSPDGDLIFSTYFGGSYSDGVTGLAVDRAGLLHLSGFTDSAQFPLKNPIRDACTPVFPNQVRCVLDSFVATIDPRVPRLLFSTYLGGSDSDFPAGIAVDPRGNASVAGSTASRDFPLLSPVYDQNDRASASFVTRFLAQNQAPDCSGSVASPTLIWPPNGKMVPISILGITDPEGDPVALKIIGITQDEPGTSFSGVGSSTAQVKAERDGKGDGRVYHILFEAADPSGASCAGEVTVCVPHDQGKYKGSCVDSGALVSSSR